MIEILQQYWKAYLWTDGLQMTGVAMTAWLLVLSIGIGFVLAVPLSLARVSENICCVAQFGCLLCVRGTPLYIQLLIIYSGIYSFDYVHEHQALDAFFREGIIAPFWHSRSILVHIPLKSSLERSVLSTW